MTIGCKPGIPPAIIRPTMLAAIDLDHQPFLQNGEVDDERPDGNLTTHMQAERGSPRP